MCEATCGREGAAWTHYMDMGLQLDYAWYSGRQDASEAS